MEIETVLIPEGEFWMGMDRIKRSHPRHLVFLDRYRIGKYPVTVAQFRTFCSEHPKDFDWKKRSPDWGWIDDHPMINVTWHEAAEFCKWAGGFLPTEARWEKAARGVDGREYPWEGGWDPSKCRCSKGQRGDSHSTSAVGSYPAGVSPFGCLDMAGNTWEWCSDWYSEGYPDQPNQNPIGPETGDWRSLRGGSWSDMRPDYFRASFRGHYDPGYRNGGSGFRLAYLP